MLCISGKRFSGKDSFARACVAAARRRGQELALYAFADESKRMLAERDADVDLARLQGERAYKEHIRPRLTQFTVEALAKDPLVFVSQVAGRIDRDPRLPLISDLRLKIELDWLEPRFELVVVRVLRPDALRAASGWVYDETKDRHFTETDLDDRNFEVVANDGTEAQLAERADALIERFLSPRSGR
jgi:phosphomevalonate kinase